MSRKNHPKRPLTTMSKWNKFQDYLVWKVFEKKSNKVDNLNIEADVIEKEQGKFD